MQDACLPLDYKMILLWMSVSRCICSSTYEGETWKRWKKLVEGTRCEGILVDFSQKRPSSSSMQLLMTSVTLSVTFSTAFRCFQISGKGQTAGRCSSLSRLSRQRRASHQRFRTVCATIFRPLGVGTCLTIGKPSSVNWKCISYHFFLLDMRITKVRMQQDRLRQRRNSNAFAIFGYLRCVFASLCVCVPLRFPNKHPPMPIS